MRNVCVTALLVLLGAASAYSQATDAQASKEALIVYKQLLGDEKQAETAVNAARTLTANSPFDFKTAIDATTRLVNLKFPPAKMLELLTVSADTAVGTQTGSFMRGRTFINMAETIAEILRLEDGRNIYRGLTKLSLVGVPVFEALGDQLGVSAEEARRLTIEGGFVPDKTVGWIIDYCKKRYAGLAKKIAETR
jgi:hypothetical protein